MMKKIISVVMGVMSLITTVVHGLRIETFGNPNSSTIGRSVIDADSDSYISVINIANDYLWFSLALISVISLVYVGFQLMTSQGDKAKMQKANRAIVGMVIGLLIAYFSYTVIRMVANWF